MRGGDDDDEDGCCCTTAVSSEASFESSCIRRWALVCTLLGLRATVVSLNRAFGGAPSGDFGSSSIALLALDTLDVVVPAALPLAANAGAFVAADAVLLVAAIALEEAAAAAALAVGDQSASSLRLWSSGVERGRPGLGSELEEETIGLEAVTTGWWTLLPPFLLG